MAPTTPVVSEIHTVLGDSRTVTRTYEDGSVDCPYCYHPIIYPGTSCSNPACDSSPYWTPVRLTAYRAQRDASIALEEDRKRNHRLAMERIRGEKEARDARLGEAIAECKRQGACLRCMAQPDGSFKFIRHRKECPKARR